MMKRSGAAPAKTEQARALPGQIVLAFQGGGALTAYQGGVYQALHEAGIAPDWVIGTSSGAINAGIIAGNPPEKRLDCLREFWTSMEYEAATSTAGVVRRVAEPWDDLQTAGLSNGQLAKPFDLEHLIQEPLAPTVAELRRHAIYSNYTAIMETTTEGGFGLLFGPDRNRPVYGREYLALARAAPDDDVVTLMVQIPANFDLRHRMIVIAPSSGSRGVYGAISTAEWAFLNGCAIAYTDKGTAPGLHDLDSGLVYDVEGRPIDAQNTQAEPAFRVAPSPDLTAFKTEFPHRLAAKHAHSRKNIELHWGTYVLLSIDFAFYCLNEYLGSKYGSFDRTNTKVMATGVSNGGGAAILAAEQDDAINPLIDAVVVSEPQVQPTPTDFVIRFRDEEFKNHSRSLLDTVTLMNLYAPCAAFVLDTRRSIP